MGFGARRPRLALWLMIFLGCAAVAVAVTRLELQTSRADLLAPEESWNDYTKTFGGDSELIVLVKTKDPDEKQIRKVLDQLADRLKREPEYFSGILYKIDQSNLRRKALQYLSPDELRSAIRRVKEYGPVLAQQDWELLRIELMAQTLDAKIRTAAAQQKSIDRAVMYSDRLATSLDRFLDVDGEEIRLNERSFSSPWPEIVSAEIEHSAQDEDIAYLMDASRRVGMLHVKPAVDENGERNESETLTRLREHLSALEAEYQEADPDLQLAVTGIPVLERDELRRSGRDMMNASLIAFLGVGLLLTFGLRGMRHPMLVLIMLIMALAITFGIAGLAVGHLNILSICFVAIMIGLGVDFGIHFVTRYLFLRQELYEMDESLVLTGQSVGTGILTSALTTAVAFGSAALTGYPGLAELGIVAAVGILVCAFLTFTFLPALIALSDEPVEIDELPVPLSGDFWRSAVSGYPKTAILLATICVIALAYNAVHYEDGNISSRVAYDSNLLHLQDRSLDSVQAERILAASDESLLYAVTIAESEDEADALRTRLLSLASVSRVTDLSSRLPEPPTEEQKQLIGSLKASLENIPRRTPSFKASDNELVGNSLDQLYKTLSASGNLQAHEAAKKLDAFLDRFAPLTAEQQSTVLESYQNRMAASLLNDFSEVVGASSLDPVTLEDLPESWRNRYLRTDDGRQLWLLKIYPKEDVWNEAALASFVQDIRSVAPDVTGAPVQNYDSAVKLKECYHSIAIYSLVAISLFLLFEFLRPGQKLLTMIPPLMVVGFIGYTTLQREGAMNLNMLIGIYVAIVAFVATVFDFRNLRDTLIAMIPALGGGMMLLGLMALLKIDFNPINLIVLPLVLGIGVDDGVHMVHDYRRQLRDGAKQYLPSGDTINGVVLTSLTSIIGFGSLMISAHTGLQSVGIVLALGIACCMAVALVLVPPLLVIVARSQPASFEPVIVRTPKAEKQTAAGEDGGGQSDDGQQSGNTGERRLSRKERRRQQQAA